MPQKYDQFGRRTDGTRKDWMVTQPHGGGSFRYETQEAAESNAARFAREGGWPVQVWRAVAEYDVAAPPVVRTDLTADA